MTAPIMSSDSMPIMALPPVASRMASVLKNIPEPITMPTTIVIAVNRPYFF